MRPVLLLAATLAGLAAAPALADNGQVQHYDIMAGLPSAPRAPGCFSGRYITGVSRADDRAVYVQTRAGGVYRLELASQCKALSVAHDVSLRAWGTWSICPGGRAELVAATPGGEKRCRADEVRPLNADEQAELAGRR